jgi:hypothetical protein
MLCKPKTFGLFKEGAVYSVEISEDDIKPLLMMIRAVQAIWIIVWGNSTGEAIFVPAAAHQYEAGVMTQDMLEEYPVVQPITPAANLHVIGTPVVLEYDRNHAIMPYTLPAIDIEFDVSLGIYLPAGGNDHQVIRTALEVFRGGVRNMRLLCSDAFTEKLGGTGFGYSTQPFKRWKTKDSDAGAKGSGKGADPVAKTDKLPKSGGDEEGDKSEDATPPVRSE